MSAGSQKVVLITGGSSGIGFECARLLLMRGHKLVLAARDQNNLDAAKSRLSDELASGAIDVMRLDVCDAAACVAAVATIVERHGGIDWLITCAGIAEPGMFADLPMQSHRHQMETNYFGTLNVVQPVASMMRERRSGRIMLVASGAAFVGIAGYSGYTPGKCAVRALGEALYVELASFGVSVCVAFPPDTDTPQLAQENRTKPVVTKAITASGNVWPAPVIARRLLDQAEAGRFMLTPTVLMTLFSRLHSLYAPAFLRRQIRMLRTFTRP